MNEKAETLFTVSWINANLKITQIHSFRTAILEFEKGIEDKHYKEAEALVNKIKNSNEFDIMFKDKQGFLKACGGDKEITMLMAKKNAGDTRKLLDASTLIFVHSVLDGFIFDMIKVIKEIAPKSFFNRYKDQKIKLCDIRENEDEIILNFIEKEKIDRNPL
jgi:hypothetical protein